MATKQATEHNYYVIVPVLNAGSLDRLVAVLVKRGYKVGPLASNHTAYLTTDENLVTLITVNVWKHVPNDIADPRTAVFDDIKDILKVIEAKYIMLWVGEPMMCNWGLGNVKKSEKTVAFGDAEIPKKDLN